jgi:hypothetical protein
LSDIDSDGWPEIIAANKKGLYVLDRNGRVLPGWPHFFEQPSVSSPAIGDVNRDGYHDIVIANGNKLYVFNFNGAIAAGFPVRISGSTIVQSSPILMQLSGGGGLDIVIGSPDGRLCAFDGRGNVIPGFPLTVGGGVLSTPMVWDMDNDPSSSELLVGCDDGKLYAWSLPVGLSDSWHRFHADACQSGYRFGSDPWMTDDNKLENLYVYPNPVRKTSAKIRFKAVGLRYGNAKVFNLAGDLVQDVSFDVYPCAENEVRWDTSNLASGVYIIRVEARGLNGSKVLTCKAAVIK